MDTSKEYIEMRLAAIPDLGMGIPPELADIDPEWLSIDVFVDIKDNHYELDW